jgi:hypothetical protein
MLLYKKVPHNFEVHFEDKLFDTRPVQFLDLDSDYLVPVFKDMLRNYESAVFDDWWSETYNTHIVSEDFGALVVCNFKSFFKGISIDTPRCFSNSHSLKRDINKYDVYKLNNYSMRSGKSLKTYLLLLRALQSAQATNYAETFTSKGLTSWMVIYNLLNNINISSGYSRLSDNLRVSGPHERAINELGIEYNNLNDHRLKLIDNLKVLEPMFLFYIYKVDKNIYKNSRGRSGKFTFLWKYIAPYKRRHIVMSWLMKEVKMQPGRDFYSRLSNVITNVVNNPNSSFISRVRKFSYNYVYYNCRKTLAETYRTSTK